MICVSRHAIRWIAIALFYALIGAVASRSHPADPDEGLVLNAAWNILNGRKPYVDFFEFVAPGSFYAVAAAWTLLGAPEYFAARAIGLLAVAGAAFAIVDLNRTLSPGGLSLVPVAIFVLIVLCGPVVNHNTFFILPAAWSVAYAARHVKRPSLVLLCLAGLASGATLLVLQHKGALLTAAIACGLFVLGRDRNVRMRIREIGVFLACALLPLAALLSWPVEAIRDSLIDFPLRRYISVQSVSWRSIIITSLCACWVFWLARRASHPRVLAFLVIVQLFMLVSALPRPDIIHLAAVLFPVSAALAVLCANSASRSPTGASPRARAAKATIALSCGLLLAASAMLFASVTSSNDALSGPRARLIRLVDEHCGRSRFIHVGPFAPHLYYELRRTSATRFSLLIDKFNTPEHFEIARAELEQRPEDCVLVVRGSGPLVAQGSARKFGHAGANVVDEYLERNYLVVHEVDGVSILRHR